MSATRRDLLRWGAVSGAALFLAVPWDAESAAEALASPPPPFAPNSWIRIGSDGAVSLVVPRAEMGQGVRTSLAMLLAEELDVDLERVTVLQASPGPDYRRMRTGGSASVQGAFAPFRKAGAAAREMLVAAAAAGWGVPLASCRTENEFVVHGASGRRARYGDLVAAAAKQAVPKAPALKEPKEFRLLGRPRRKVDGPGIVTGRAVYGLDVKVPGMRVAALARPPVLGGRPLRVDESRARAVAGVSHVVRVGDAVAVVATDSWSALKGRDALVIAWDDGPNGAVDSESHWKRLEEAGGRAGYPGRHEGDPPAALAASAKRLSAVYRFPFQAHAPVEPMNAIANVGEGSCEIWVGTQAANQAQELAAKKLGLPLEQVTVNMALLGGGFGRRLAVDYVGEAVDVSKAVGGPVQVIWNQADDVRHGHFQPAFVPVETPLPTGPWRAVFYPPCVFARESFLDEAAATAGKDPLALRLELLALRDVVKVFDYAIDRGRQARVLEVAAEKSGWGSPLPVPPGRRAGRGLACNVYDSDTYVAQVAEVSVGKDGDVRVHRIVTALDAGFIVNPLGAEGQVESGVAWALSAALHGEITIRNGRVVQSGYRDFPVVRLADTPALETHFVPGAATSPGGSRSGPRIWPEAGVVQPGMLATR